MSYETLKSILDIKDRHNIDESRKDFKIDVEKYGKNDVDFTELWVYLAGDDLIEINHNASTKFDNAGGGMETTWEGNYYSWMDDPIEIVLSVGGKKITLTSSYNEDTDRTSWVVDGAKHKVITKEIHGRKRRDVVVIPIKANTKDVKIISCKALRS